MTVSTFRTPWIWTGLWLVVMAAALFARPLLPMDETRYLAVAWEMWFGGDFLVPHLNGETYSHKPPLLFWLINLGWGVFGVNDWWPRLVAPLFGLASLFLTARLARVLWPGEDNAPITLYAPLVAFGGLFWSLYTTLTMFDMILAFCTLLGLLGVVRAWASKPWTGFALMGLGIGLGVLTKGPAILLHILPVALMAPLWGRHLQGGSAGWGRWYAGILGAVLLGAAIGLAWAIPAGIAGGEAYREAIFWGQSAGRVTSSFAHARPWWWYMVVLPVMLLPWLIWPPIWRAVSKAGRRFKDGNKDGGLRFCIAWIVPAFVVFSLISGKQPHYLLPELPAIALVLVRLLTAVEAEDKKSAWDPVLPGLFVLGLGVALTGLHGWPLPAAMPPWLGMVAAPWGLVIVAAGLGAFTSGRWALPARIAVIGSLSAVVVVASHLAMRPVLRAVYDLKPVAMQLAEWQKQGVPLANYSKYHGQYNFLGRLTKPIAQVGMFSPDTANFIKTHPKGRIIAYHDKPILLAEPLMTFRFRSRLIAIWDASVVARHPGVTER
ncbi:MAG: glycosyltransferase family 39 protein [Rhodospirillales bacterium]|nr:glycosyltransferase family 39 protein [Rhodospirillales bacterium]